MTDMCEIPQQELQYYTDRKLRISWKSMHWTVKCT